MYIDLSGVWKIQLHTDLGFQEGDIRLPGVLQAQGFGNEITYKTPWVSGLHDPYWWEREEYQYAQEEGTKVSFLAQPPKHYLGKALYKREFEIEEEINDTWYLYIELTHWRSKVWIDEQEMGEDCSLCTAHRIECGYMTKGKHIVEVEIDNAMQYPYRPDGHGVSDALGATWNGMVGELALITESKLLERDLQKWIYAKEHARHIEVKDGKFYVDGVPEYFRGTHFGGDYPLSGYPSTDKAWWREKLGIIKAWGLNFVRCHSYCPPEAAFQVADEMGIYLQPECSMWNHFEDGIPMLEVLREETRRILEQFGHHPSFVLFSPTNEPSGNWYQVLRKWVDETREYDKWLGYENRRVYTAQSGWYYEVAPAKVKGTDYLYFHRSNFGPIFGGMIRNSLGWKGKNYSPSVIGTDKPVICHELGQWCAYPEFNQIEKFTGYLKPGNLEVFRENCKANGLLEHNEQFAWCSGRNQVRLYKEDIEANLRTPEICGYELLDLHDYLGQGTALVGVLDAFWDEKGYVKPAEFRQFCNETVLLAAFEGYVYTNRQKIKVPIRICHYGKARLHNATISWSLLQGEKVLRLGEVSCQNIDCGKNTELGYVDLDFDVVKGNQILTFRLQLEDIAQNEWELYVYEEMKLPKDEGVLYTRDWTQTKEGLQQGRKVVYAPYLSELDYECPPVSMKNVFWNAQMGPKWGRSLGLVVEQDSPLFHYFPTMMDGGWQWEDILAYARGYCMRGMEQVQPLVRVIDDWNRNLPLALIWEAQVDQGKLLVIAADLDGEFEERPAAYALKEAILEYASSEYFNPKDRVTYESIEQHLFPMNRMEELTETIFYDKDASIEHEKALVTADPGQVVCIEKKDFPITVTIQLKEAVEMEGLLFVPEQRDRFRYAFPKNYEVFRWDESKSCWNKIEVAGNGSLKNSSLSQKIIFKESYTTRFIKLVILSCYGSLRREDWEERQDGYYKVEKTYDACVKIGGIHVLCKHSSVSNQHNFEMRQQRSLTKEIEE